MSGQLQMEFNRPGHRSISLTKKMLAGFRPLRAEDAHGPGLEADTNFFLLNLSERGAS